MIRFTHDPSNEAQDGFAMQYGEAHLVEFQEGVIHNGKRYYAAFTSTYAEARELAQQGGKIRGYINLRDFYPDWDSPF